MANIARFDPFNQLDDLFKGFLVRPMRFDIDMPEKMNIKVDVTKTDDTCTVKAEMPGVKKDDISISMDGNMITIAGEVKKESEEKKEKGRGSDPQRALLRPRLAQLHPAAGDRRGEIRGDLCRRRAAADAGNQNAGGRQETQGELNTVAGFCRTSAG